MSHTPHTVLYRAYHPTTRQLGWSGFVENGVTVYLGWDHSRLRLAFKAWRTARRNAKW